MLQNPCKTLGFKKNMVYKIPPGGEVNHIQPVAYLVCVCYAFVCDCLLLPCGHLLGRADLLALVFDVLL